MFTDEPKVAGDVGILQFLCYLYYTKPKKMRKIILIFILLAGVYSLSSAQKTKSLKKVIELQMPEGLGTNGAGVVYHPLQKKYYASFAGNIEYPIAVFDLKGKRLSEDDLMAGFDVRGLWYNTVTKTIQANGYNDFGWTDFKLDKKGMPIENKVFMEGMHQPGEQSVGTFDSKAKQVYFLSGNKVITYDLKGEQKSEKTLQIPEEEMEDLEEADMLPEKYNYTTVLFTGIPQAEWGIYDSENAELVLFNKATGKITQKWQLDSNAPNAQAFCLAYTNGILFLFDKDERTWYGYK